jgi:hypothetical protein
MQNGVNSLAQLSLAALIPLRADIARMIKGLDYERRKNAFVEHLKGEKAEAPTRSFDVITKELHETREDFRVIDQLIHQANLVNTITWSNQEVSLFTAIQIAKHMRREAEELFEFGSKKKEDFSKNSYANETTITRAMYDVEATREDGLKLDRKVKRLSQLIEDECHKIMLEFPRAEKYIELED